MSLEVVCCLFALKVKYPNSIYLLRGSHEDATINRHEGLGFECQSRLRDKVNSQNSVFHWINKVFEYLPLAAVLNENMFCVHGGIGENVHQISLINSI